MKVRERSLYLVLLQYYNLRKAIHFQTHTHYLSKMQDMKMSFSITFLHYLFHCQSTEALDRLVIHKFTWLLTTFSLTPNLSLRQPSKNITSPQVTHISAPINSVIGHSTPRGLRTTSPPDRPTIRNSAPSKTTQPRCARTRTQRPGRFESPPTRNSADTPPVAPPVLTQTTRTKKKYRSPAWLQGCASGAISTRARASANSGWGETCPREEEKAERRARASEAAHRFKGTQRGTDARASRSLRLFSAFGKKRSAPLALSLHCTDSTRRTARRTIVAGERARNSTRAAECREARSPPRAPSHHLVLVRAARPVRAALWTREPRVSYWTSRGVRWARAIFDHARGIYECARCFTYGDGIELMGSILRNLGYVGVMCVRGWELCNSSRSA